MWEIAQLKGALQPAAKTMFDSHNFSDGAGGARKGGGEMKISEMH